MERIIVLSDIHSNLPALISVFSHLEITEMDEVKIIVNGDAISLGPSPVECLEFLQRFPQIDYVIGNNDRYVIERVFESDEPFHTDLPGGVPEEIKMNLAWTCDQLSAEHIDFIKGWQKSIVVPMGNKEVCIAHGVPWNDEECLHADTPDSYLEEKLSKYDCYVSGHYHIPMIRELSGKLYVNAGSVGSPLDGNSDGCYLTITHENNSLRPILHRVKYELRATIDELKRKNVPGADLIAPVLEKGSF